MGNKALAGGRIHNIHIIIMVEMITHTPYTRSAYKVWHIIVTGKIMHVIRELLLGKRKHEMGGLNVGCREGNGNVGFDGKWKWSTEVDLR